MNKKISLVVFALGILLLGSGLANAEPATDIWTNIYNTGGYTKYAQMTLIGGPDWSEGAATTEPTDYNREGPTPRYTAAIYEGFENEGDVIMEKGLSTPTAWELEGRVDIFGSGNTLIWKEATVWTEDKKINPCTGKLLYPTQAWIEIEFSTLKPFLDEESWYVLMDTPDAYDEKVATSNPQFAGFSKYIQTNENFGFSQKVGINNFPSDYVIPRIPDLPEFHWISSPQ